MYLQVLSIERERVFRNISKNTENKDSVATTLISGGPDGCSALQLAIRL